MPVLQNGSQLLCCQIIWQFRSATNWSTRMALSASSPESPLLCNAFASFDFSLHGLTRVNAVFGCSFPGSELPLPESALVRHSLCLEAVFLFCDRDRDSADSSRAHESAVTSSECSFLVTQRQLSRSSLSASPEYSRAASGAMATNEGERTSRPTAPRPVWAHLYLIAVQTRVKWPSRIPSGG